MTASDFARLRLYRQKRGPLNPILRTDAALALLCAVTANSNGAKRRDGQPFAQSDFMPWIKDDEDECASPEQLLAMFKTLASTKRTDK